MTQTIMSHPQANIVTYPLQSDGTRRRTVVTSKQFILNRLLDGQTHRISEFTRRISYDGFRGRISELRHAGYSFERTATTIRLVTLPGVTNFFPVSLAPSQ